MVQKTWLGLKLGMGKGVMRPFLFLSLSDLSIRSSRPAPEAARDEEVGTRLRKGRCEGKSRLAVSRKWRWVMAQVEGNEAIAFSGSKAPETEPRGDHSRQVS